MAVRSFLRAVSLAAPRALAPRVSGPSGTRLIATCLRLEVRQRRSLEKFAAVSVGDADKGEEDRMHMRTQEEPAKPLLHQQSGLKERRQMIEKDTREEEEEGGEEEEEYEPRREVRSRARARYDDGDDDLVPLKQTRRDGKREAKRGSREQRWQQDQDEKEEDDFAEGEDGGGGRRQVKNQAELKKMFWERMEVVRSGAARAAELKKERKEQQPVSYPERGKTLPMPEIFSDVTIDSLNLHPQLRENISQLGFEKLSGIQGQVMPSILKNRADLIIASETGTGKTLSYIIPLVQHVIDRRTVDPDVGRGRPRALILVPTRELASQVKRVLTGLVARLPVTVAGLFSVSGNNSVGKDDIVIATPGNLQEALGARQASLRDVSMLAVDEADMMFDKTFAPQTLAFIASCKHHFLPADQKGGHARNAELLVVGATITDAMVTTLREHLPNMGLITTRTLHRPPPGIRFDFIMAKDSAHKNAALVRLAQSVERLLVFADNQGACEAAYRALTAAGISCTHAHGMMTKGDRRTNFKLFNDYEVKALVCTDFIARGVDFIGLPHVMMYDFPRSSADFLHRAGRTGRMGKSGAVTILMDKRHVNTRDRIIKALKAKQPLNGLFDANSK